MFDINVCKRNSIKLNVLSETLRGSRPEVFYKVGVLKDFAKFTGKHLRQSLFFNKVAGLGRFPLNFLKSLRTSFLTQHLFLQWLLLDTDCNKVFFKNILFVNLYY